MIHPTAVVETNALGPNVSIGAYAVVRAGVRIGEGAVIHPHVVIEPGAVIGNGVEIFPFAYVGKEPKGAGALARKPSFSPRVVIGNNCSVGPHTVIYYDVEIGENTLVGDGASIREKCRIGSRCVIGRQVTLNYCVEVGDGTKIMDHAWMAGNMRLGQNVFISGGVLTANDDEVGRHGYKDAEIIGPTIEDQSVVGVGAILLPRLVVGSGAVVGAGAVVTRDVAPSTVVMGIPARLVRQVKE